MSASDRDADITPAHDPARDPWVIAEDLIRQLPSVLGVAIRRDDAESVEVQVVTPRGTARDPVRTGVERILRQLVPMPGRTWILTMETRDEADVDETVGNGRAVRGALLGGRRPILREAVLRDQDGEGLRASVTLMLNGDAYVGWSSGPGESTGLGTVAEATLRALDRVIGTEGTFRLRSVALVELRDDRSVCVNLVQAIRPERLLIGGARAAAEGPQSVAVARATLDAVNRQL